MEGSVSISGKTYPIEWVRSNNKHASARLRADQITISIPSRWPNKEKERVGKKLLDRAINNITKGRWGTREMKKVQFTPGQEFEILGKKFRITNPSNHKKIVKGISRNVLPLLEQRIRELNDSHFRSQVRKVSIRDNTARWGSFSPNGNVSLNFKLLFAPSEILDYVIVHELAHSRYKSHGPRFWSVVEGIMPDHKVRRKWLRKNGHRLGQSTPKLTDTIRSD